MEDLILILNSAIVNTKDSERNTALMKASRNGHNEVAEYLKSVGAK